MPAGGVHPQHTGPLTNIHAEYFQAHDADWARWIASPRFERQSPRPTPFDAPHQNRRARRQLPHVHARILDAELAPSLHTFFW